MSHSTEFVRLNRQEAEAIHGLIEWAKRHRHPELSRGALLDPFSPYSTAADKLKPIARAMRHQGMSSIEEEGNG